MTAGRGFIALARSSSGTGGRSGAGRVPLVRVLERARDEPARVLAVGVDLFEALPYVLTLVAVAGVIGRSIPPPAATAAATSSSSVARRLGTAGWGSLLAGLARS